MWREELLRAFMIFDWAVLRVLVLNREILFGGLMEHP
jgi:hypothetical protein